MKKQEEVIKAIKDWVNDRIKTTMEETDPDTILRKTGDASKVTNVFSKAGSRVLPKSGEELDVTLGKILKYLSDLKYVAFSGSYTDISYRAIRLLNRIENYSNSAAYTNTIITGKADNPCKKVWLILGFGGSSTASANGATDFARAYLVSPKYEASTATNDKGRTFILLQIGSVGSTARYTLTANASTGQRDEKITVTIPKGSYANVYVYELDTWYVG